MTDISHHYAPVLERADRLMKLHSAAAPVLERAYDLPFNSSTRADLERDVAHLVFRNLDLLQGDGLRHSGGDVYQNRILIVAFDNCDASPDRNTRLEVALAAFKNENVRMYLGSHIILDKVRENFPENNTERRAILNIVMEVPVTFDGSEQVAKLWNETIAQLSPQEALRAAREAMAHPNPALQGAARSKIRQLLRPVNG